MALDDWSDSIGDYSTVTIGDAAGETTVPFQQVYTGADTDPDYGSPINTILPFNKEKVKPLSSYPNTGNGRLYNAVAAIGPINIVTLTIDIDDVMGDDVTIPSNLTILPMGGIISDGGNILTVPNLSQIIYSQRQVFSLTKPMVTSGIFNVALLGASQDSATDNSSYVQMANDSLTNGGIIYFPNLDKSNYYYIPTTIELSDNIAVKGDDQTYIRGLCVASGGGIKTIPVFTNDDTVGGNSNITLDNLRIHGGYIGGGAIGTSQVVVSTDYLGTTVRFEYVENLKIVNCKIQTHNSNTMAGKDILCAALSVEDCTHVDILDSFVYDNWSFGFVIQGSRYVTVANLHADDNGLSPLELWYNTYVEVSGSSFNQPENDNSMINSCCKHASYSNNTFNAWNGIDLTNEIGTDAGVTSWGELSATISGNTFNCDGPPIKRSSNTANSIMDVVIISGNAITSTYSNAYATGIYMSQVKNLVIDGGSIVMSDTATKTRAIRLGYVDHATISNITVQAHLFLECRMVGTLVSGLDVHDNVFTAHPLAANPSADGWSSGIYFNDDRTDTGVDTTLQDVIIHDNEFRSCEGFWVKVGAQETGHTLYNQMKIHDNLFTSTANGCDYSLYTYNVDQLTIKNNELIDPKNMNIYYSEDPIIKGNTVKFSLYTQAGNTWVVAGCSGTAIFRDNYVIDGVSTYLNLKGDASHANTWDRIFFSGNSPATAHATQTYIGPIIKTGDYTVLDKDLGLWLTNTGAGGTVTFALPAATPGMSVGFVRNNAAQVIRVDPNVAEIIMGGGAGKYASLDTDYGFVWLECKIAGRWEIVYTSGTVSFEA